VIRGECEVTQRCKFLCLNQSYHKEQVREARMNMQNMKDKLGSAQTPTSTPATVITATAATASGDSEIYAACSVLMYATAVHLPRVSFPLRLRSHIGLSMPAHVHTDHADWWLFAANVDRTKFPDPGTSSKVNHLELCDSCLPL